mmetsp:Transcript_22489/g.64713  ORF Transcript_22489/g.64713 Transcript_22489/m.64713 type:complete len:349 (-) Transcript_22489:426-1472(-)
MELVDAKGLALVIVEGLEANSDQFLLGNAWMELAHRAGELLKSFEMDDIPLFSAFGLLHRRLQILESDLDALDPVRMAHLQAFGNLFAVLVVHGRQNDLGEDATREKHERQPKEEERFVVRVRCRQSVGQHRGRHCREHCVSRLPEVFESLVDRCAVSVLLSKVVEHHGTDPCPDQNGADKEQPDGDNSPDNTGERYHNCADPRNADRKAETHEGRDSDIRVREEADIKQVGEPEQDHEVVKDHCTIACVACANVTKVAVQLRRKEYPGEDDGEHDVLNQQADAQWQEGQAAHWKLGRSGSVTPTGANLVRAAELPDAPGISLILAPHWRLEQGQHEQSADRVPGPRL